MILKKVWLFLTIIILFNIANAVSEDAVDGEINDEVEGEKQQQESEKTNIEKKPVKKDSKPQQENYVIKSSSDADVTILFTTTSSNDRELIAGKIIKFLIGFANKGEKDFIIKYCDTSFRYPLDFNYQMQNFTPAHYNQVVQPKQEATFDYSFIAPESLVGRPVGLVVNLFYDDTDGAKYAHAVYNETLNITEDETIFNTETGFLYVVLAGLIVLILLIGQHYLSKFTKKQSTSYQPSQEIGTKKEEVDYEWIPRTILTEKKISRTRKSTKTN